jgi:hypothetical protein
MSTHNTTELGLAFAITALGMPTGAASMALVDHLLEWELAEGACFPSDSTDVVAGIVSDLKRAPERTALFWCGQQLHLCDELHTMKCIVSERLCQPAVAAQRFLPWLRPMGFRAYGMPYQQ